MTNRQTISFLTQRFKDAGIRPDTRHGQNFLIDLNLVHLLVNTAVLDRRDVVLEVGTGTGSLTALLAQRAAAVVSVEISAELHQLAQEELVDFDNVTLLRRDALKNKNRLHPDILEELAKHLAVDPCRRLKLVANLPYSIATPVISNLLSTDVTPYSMTVTIQKELADRITAQPRTKDYSALSVWIQSQCDAEVVRILPPSVFWPRPRVHSAIMQVTPQADKLARIPQPEFFHTFVRGLFLHRRKFLRSGLVSVYKKQLSKEVIDGLLAELELGVDARAEQLDVNQLIALAQRFQSALALAGADPSS
ncbi:MAG: 16S rRNA (adenine(1518)-N(6)/adenine(1519)-N(6))-dimethyltransferase RsmA [Pirellulaceae bacterium]